MSPFSIDTQTVCPPLIFPGSLSLLQYPCWKKNVLPELSQKHFFLLMALMTPIHTLFSITLMPVSMSSLVCPLSEYSLVCLHPPCPGLQIPEWLGPW